MGKGPFAALKCSYLFTHPVKWDRHTQYGILKTLSLHVSQVTHQASAYLQFLLHEAPRSISTPPWMECQLLTVSITSNAIHWINCYPVVSVNTPNCTTIHWLVILIYPMNSVIHLSNNPGLYRERHCESKVSCPRTQHNVPGQGLNP